MSDATNDNLPSSGRDDLHSFPNRNNDDVEGEEEVRDEPEPEDDEEEENDLDKHVCGKCNEEFTSIQDYLEHKMKAHQVAVRYTKNKKNKRMMIPRLIKKRDSISKNNNENDDKQAVKYKREKEQLNPDNLVSNDMEYQCSKCPKRFRRQKALQRHEEYDHQEPDDLSDVDMSEETNQGDNSRDEDYTLKSNDESIPRVPSPAQQLMQVVQTGDGETVLHVLSLPGSQIDGQKRVREITPSRMDNSKRINCTVCGKSVKDSNVLRAHMVTHSDHRPFKCSAEGCTYAFKTKGALVRHFRRHTGDRPYRCKQCGRSFTESGALTRHNKSRIPCSEKKDADLPRYGSRQAFAVNEKGSHTSSVSLEFDPKVVKLQQKLAQIKKETPDKLIVVKRMMPVMSLEGDVGQATQGQTVVFVQEQSPVDTTKAKKDESGNLSLIADVVGNLSEDASLEQTFQVLQDNQLSIAYEDHEEPQRAVQEFIEGNITQDQDINEKHAPEGKKIKLAERKDSICEDENNDQHQANLVQQVQHVEEQEPSLAVASSQEELVMADNNTGTEVMELHVQQEEDYKKNEGEHEYVNEIQLVTTINDNDIVMTQSGPELESQEGSSVSVVYVQESIENDPRRCEVCSLIVEDVSMRSHLLDHVRSMPNRCLTCQAVFETQAELDQHQVVAHSIITEPEQQNNEQEGKGDLVVTEIPAADTMKVPINVTDNKKREAAHALQILLETNENWENLQAEESELTKKGQYCPICQTSTRGISYLRLHMRTHIDDKEHKCPKCKKAFENIWILKRHMSQHGQEKKIACGICGKKFKRIGHVTEHLKSHSNFRPYQCKYCVKAFKTKNACKVHTRTHASYMPYKCNRCPRAFREKSSLDRHLRTHTGEKPYKCPYCGKGFAEHGTLNRHMRAKTPCVSRMFTLEGNSSNQHVVIGNPKTMDIENVMIQQTAPVNTIYSTVTEETAAAQSSELDENSDLQAGQQYILIEQNEDKLVLLDPRTNEPVEVLLKESQVLEQVGGETTTTEESIEMDIPSVEQTSIQEVVMTEEEIPNEYPSFQK